MFSKSAEFYDVIYGTFKDYAAEAARIAHLVRDAQPNALTILDVACGTGEHALHLRRDHGFAVDGLDLDPGLLAVARAKVPQAQFFAGDMSAFALPRKFDVVMCLFSAIGYLRTLDRVTAALTCFRSHLAQDGVVIVEPWFAPGVLREGPGSNQRGAAPGVHIERGSHMAVAGRLSTLTFEYRITDAAGVRVVSEVHELGLFTPEEMLASFKAAGLTADYDATGISGRGLYSARAT